MTEKGTDGIMFCSLLTCHLIEDDTIGATTTLQQQFVVIAANFVATSCACRRECFTQDCMTAFCSAISSYSHEEAKTFIHSSVNKITYHYRFVSTQVFV